MTKHEKEVRELMRLYVNNEATRPNVLRICNSLKPLLKNREVLKAIEWMDELEGLAEIRSAKEIVAIESDLKDYISSFLSIDGA